METMQWEEPVRFFLKNKMTYPIMLLSVPTWYLGADAYMDRMKLNR